jgi:hypothetical protein
MAIHMGKIVEHYMKSHMDTDAPCYNLSYAFATTVVLTDNRFDNIIQQY